MAKARIINITINFFNSATNVAISTAIPIETGKATNKTIASQSESSFAHYSLTLAKIYSLSAVITWPIWITFTANSRTYKESLAYSAANQLMTQQGNWKTITSLHEAAKPTKKQFVANTKGLGQ